MSANHEKGKAFERDVVGVLRDNGHPYAERVPGLGRHRDDGDVNLVGFHVECKNRARLELARWMDEARAEADARPSWPIPVVVFKRRGAAAERAYVVLELHDFARLAAD